MIVKFNNREYDLDVDGIEVEHARIIKKYSGLNLKGFGEGIGEGDPDALTSLYWLMLKQNGQDHNIESVSFKAMQFLIAVMEAQLEEAKREAAIKAAETPKDESEPVTA